MASFVFTYRVPHDYDQLGSPESQSAWMTWFGSLGAGLADYGRAVVTSATLGDVAAGTRLGGYSIVTADDLDAAMELAKGCPALNMGAGVEVGQLAVPPPGAGGGA
jgi:hypothetical protein